MASSGTRTFSLQIADVIQEAYERLGVSSKGCYDLITARRSLNLLMIKFRVYIEIFLNRSVPSV